jgi:excalibur calcium-binding domain-containing protein
MRNIVTLIVIAGLAWYGYTRYQAAAHRSGGQAAPASQFNTSITESASAFTCDGRTRCSQMTSCAEATYFIEHCPNTKMDGDNDGVPCESQWCQ